MKGFKKIFIFLLCWNDPNSEKDNPNHNKNTNYNTHVRIMSYGKPR